MFGSIIILYRLLLYLCQQIKEVLWLARQRLAIPTPPTVNDNCGRVLSVSGPVVNPATINCGGTQTYTWTFTDCEGTTYPWVYTYTISPPVVSMPANTSSNVACLSAIVAPTPPSVTDNCGRLLNVTGPSISGPDCSGNKEYQYTYTDCSSNTYTWTHTFVIDIPTVTMPPPGGSTVNCHQQQQHRPPLMYQTIAVIR
ncbi:MAG: hypothetical protein IPP49_21180 [Saprospiraceae bacterium]|nr:hypothetical protein [Saprospiraceae bacterium]